MKKRKKTNRVIFHHSLSLDVSASDIKEWHRVIRGWETIGYHYVIRKDGKIEKGRNLKLQGSHAFGKNHDSVGICLTGNFWKHEPSIEQIEASLKIYHELCRAYNKTLLIEFHRKGWMPNACPGPKLDREGFIEEVSRGDPFNDLLVA